MSIEEQMKLIAMSHGAHAVAEQAIKHYHLPEEIGKNMNTLMETINNSDKKTPNVNH